MFDTANVTNSNKQTFIQETKRNKMAAHQSRMASFERQFDKLLRGSSDLSAEVKEGIIELVNKVFSRKSKRKESVPKRPPNAYILFTNQNRSEIVMELQEESGERPSSGQVTKRAGEKWNAMSKDEKAPYIEKRAALMAEFEAEHPELVLSARSSTPNSGFEFDKTDPLKQEVPSGWSKAIKGKYLHELAIRRKDGGLKEGIGKFATLAEAIDASEKLGWKSGGVTLTNRGYFVRKSNEPKTEVTAEKREYTYSWVKLVPGPMRHSLVPYDDTDNESDDDEFSTPPSSP